MTTKGPTIGFVHTVLTLSATFSALAKELVPGSDVFHIADESLLGVTRRTGTLSPATKRRVLGHILSAADAGADAVVVTCSSIGPAVDAAHDFVPVPVVRIDEAMADEAVRIGSQIGVLATLRTTLEPTAALVERRAREAGTQVEVVSRLAEGAFEALSAGEADRHDELVRGALRELALEVDVVVLAQASMARVAETLTDDERPVPILASPRLGMQRVAELVAQLPKR
ncbi:MAG: aspartate/glutamate racemase family protein [Thermoleophilia bacterium]|nr:aspartate/glutamate racemase family protein [Thermoleophilia bacterium]